MPSSALADLARGTLAKFAPTTSILLTNTSRGTPYLFACRQTVSDCASTPFWASKTHDAPSSTRKRPLDLGGEIDVAGRVDQVDGVAQPLERDARGVDGDAALLLFRVVVGLGRALVDAAELVLGAGVVEQVLGGRGLAGVDVGDDAEVADRWRSTVAAACSSEPVFSDKDS